MVGCKILIVFLGATVCLSEVCLALSFNFTMSGRDLPPMDPLEGDADAYVSVYYAFGSTGTFNKVGDSLVIDNNGNPDWEDKWAFEFTPGVSERLKFEIWDSDFDGDDLIGNVPEIYFAELYNDEDGIVEKNLVSGAGAGGRVIFNITRAEGL